MTKHAYLAVMFAIGCGSTTGAEPPPGDPGPDAAPAFVEAAHGDVPQLVSLGGSVLAAPKVRAIFFANDADVQAKTEAFLAQLATSPYWTATTAEYGVGALTVEPTIVTTDAPPKTGDALTAWLVDQLDGTHAGWPLADPDTIYSVFLPAGAVVTSPDGDSCDAYSAYHDELTGKAGGSIVYALVPRCTGGGFSDLDELTLSASHELVEAATDPRVETHGAFGDVDHDHYIWALTPGAETGDFCEYVDQANQRLVGDFMVQRTWSNASAAAGHDPCVPVMAAPYAAAAPIVGEALQLDGPDGVVKTKAVKVAMGTPKTLEVDLFSDAPTADFTVEAIDLAADFYRAPRELAFSWDRTTGHNGDKLQLTITRAKNGSDIGAGSEFALVVRAPDHSISAMWWAAAAN